MSRMSLTQILTGMAVGAALFGGVGALVAQGTGRTSPVGSLDAVRVFNEYQRKKDLNEEMTRLQDQLQAENTSRRQKIDALQATVDAMNDTDPARAGRTRELVAMQIEYKNWAETMQAEMTREDAMWTARIYREIIDATEAVAKTQGLDVVVYRDEFQPVSDPQRLREQIAQRKIIWSSPTSDVSGLVLDKLNADYRAKPRVPMLSMSVPPMTGGAAPAPTPAKP